MAAAGLWGAGWVGVFPVAAEGSGAVGRDSGDRSDSG